MATSSDIDLDLGRENPEPRIGRAPWIAYVSWMATLLIVLPWTTGGISSDASGPETGQPGAATLAVKVAGAAILILVALTANMQRTLARNLALRLYLSYIAFAAIVGVFVVRDLDDTASAARAVLFIGLIWCVSRSTDSISMAQATIDIAFMISIASIAGYVLGLGNSRGDRMTGLLPPLHPNILGALSAIGLLLAVGMSVRRVGRRSLLWLAAVVVVQSCALALTASRTQIIASLLALLIVPFLGSSGKKVIGGALLVIGVPLLLLIERVGGFSLIDIVVTRGGTTEAFGTIETRAEAWSRALDSHNDVLSIVFGSGYSTRFIDVSIDTASRIGVDGSFHAAYLMGGLLFVVVLLVVCGMVLRNTSRSDQLLYLPAVVAIIVSSYFDSVLNDVTVSSTVLLAAGWVARERVPSSMIKTPSMCKGTDS